MNGQVNGQWVAGVPPGNSLPFFKNSSCTKNFCPYICTDLVGAPAPLKGNPVKIGSYPRSCK